MIDTLLGLLTVAAALAFAWSIGAHYTGACMGMPVAARALSPSRALLLMAPLVLVGAVLASGAVEATVGHGLLYAGSSSLALALAILLAAFALTSAYNAVTIPTSTIQIFVFCVVGAGLAVGATIRWTTVLDLLVVWAVAPVAALGIGAVLLRVVDRISAGHRWASRSGPAIAGALVAVGLGASFAMGANDVSNASGPLVMAGAFSPEVAALLGGVGLVVGVLTWGRPLLRKVAFGVVDLDPKMAVAAQLSQSVVILTSVAFGYFTSMNQSLVGAMIGAGLSRGKTPVRWKAVRDILLGWTVGPVSGAAMGFAVTWAFVRGGIL